MRRRHPPPETVAAARARVARLGPGRAADAGQGEWIVAPGEFPEPSREPGARRPPAVSAEEFPDPSREPMTRRRASVAVGELPGPAAEPMARRPVPAAPRPDPTAGTASPRSTHPAPPPPAEPAPAPRPVGGGVVAGLLPDVLARARIDPGRRGVRVVAAVAMVAAVVTGVAVWRGRPVPVPVAAPLPGPTASAPAGEVVVAVSGRVRRPGLVRLRPGARVADAVAAAGGVLPGTALGLLNLARKVVDGELIVVGVPAADAPAGVAPGPAAAGGAPGPASGARLSLNTATVAQLDELPGIGPVLAQRIVDFRTSRGGFRSVEQLREVDGVGESRYQRLKDLVTL